jgi:hypothetical protein
MFLVIVGCLTPGRREVRLMARDARTDEQLARLQAQVDDLKTLLAHHNEHGWDEPDEEAHDLRRLLQVRRQLARVKGEQYTPDPELLERLREAERERSSNDTGP